MDSTQYGDRVSERDNIAERKHPREGETDSVSERERQTASQREREYQEREI